MGSKLLFLVGIVAAHGALAAALVQQEAPHQRAALASTCVNTPDTALPDLSPRAEIYAAVFMRAESITEVMQP
jgi:hypothetical protein